MWFLQIGKRFSWSQIILPLVADIPSNSGSSQCWVYRIQKLPPFRLNGIVQIPRVNKQILEQVIMSVSFKSWIHQFCNNIGSQICDFSSRELSLYRCLNSHWPIQLYTHPCLAYAWWHCLMSIDSLLNAWSWHSNIEPPFQVGSNSSWSGGKLFWMIYILR